MFSRIYSPEVLLGISYQRRTTAGLKQLSVLVIGETGIRFARVVPINDSMAQLKIVAGTRDWNDG